ncbi:GlsB/YeaQ/YmgE family stress response membrane protein [Thalassiella azotivora]
MGSVIGVIILGAVIGVLARLVLPGKQNINVLLTIVLGIVGAILGYWIMGLVASDSTILRWIVSVALAALLIVAYERISAGGSRKAVH